jgi:desulfoferrodoxin (superoxide reductase-like protein)
MEKTAVEWLEWLYKEGILNQKSFEIAKEMEKQQMIDFAYKVLTEAHFDSHRQCNVEKLYNENYTNGL